MAKHPRTLIRLAIVSVLKKAMPKFEKDIFANRMEQWLQEELPAIGVYSLSETVLETQSPFPDERSLEIAIEILAPAFDNVDDVLDEIALEVEKAFSLDALDVVLEKKIPFLLLEYKKSETGIAVDGDREIGVCTLFYNLEYSFPQDLPALDDLHLAHSGWDVQPADGNIDMESEVYYNLITKKE